MVQNILTLNLLIVLSRKSSLLITSAVYIHIRIHHECEDGIEKSILSITDWHTRLAE